MSLSLEQLAAVTRRGQDVCCVAGPGSGKTRVLVERAAWLYEQGVAPESILAITFTDKAANEMKERLVGRFSHDIEKRQAIERTPVSTIHGFCNSLLREHAIRAGLDPAFRVMDEWESKVELAAAARKVLDELAMERPGEFAALFEAWAAPMPQQALTGVFETLRMHGGAEAALGAESGYTGKAAALMDEAVAEAREALAHVEVSKSAAQAKRAERLREWIDTRGHDDGEQWLAALRKVDLKGAEDAVKQPLTRARELAKQAVPALLWERHAGERGTLKRLLVELERKYTERKRELAALDFEDLQEFASRLLGEDSEARRETQERFEAVLVDELQDNNPVQWRMVNLLRRPARFFAVGDVNQSIFGFRHARPELFRNYEAEVQASGAHIDRLERNYRSRPEILEAVEKLAGTGEFSGIEPHRLIPRDEPFAPARGPFIEVQRVTPGEEDEEDSEALWLAHRLRELHGVLQVGNPPRPLKWSDIGVLGRKATYFGSIESAFAANGIPYTLERGRNFFEEPEIIDLMNWLRVLDDPTNGMALFALLRSPYFGFGDEDLLLAHASGAYPPAEATVRIAEMRAFRAEAPVDLLLARVADETGYFHGRGAGARANQEKFLTMVRGLEEAHPGDIAAWLRVMEDLAGAEENTAPVVESGDSVLITSIHKAKGLEFPLVAVCGMDRGAGGQRGTLLFTPETGLGTRWNLDEGKESSPDIAYEEAVEAIERREEGEESRLLYVALTRAEERLLLSWRESKGRGPWPKRLENVWGIEWPAEFDTPVEKGAMRWVLRQGVPPALEREERERAVAAQWVDRWEAAPEAPPSVAVTALTHFAACPRRYWLNHEVRWPVEPVGRAAALGTEVHELLAEEKGESEASAEAKELVQRFQESELGRRASEAGRVEREFDFLLDVNGTLVRGTIDLWFEDVGGRVVVDYKTGEPSPERLAEYGWQVQAYGVALERLLGRVPEEGYVFLLNRREAVRVAMGEEARRQVEQLIGVFREAGERGEYPMRPGKQCEYCPFWRGACESGHTSESAE